MLGDCELGLERPTVVIVSVQSHVCMSFMHSTHKSARTRSRLQIGTHENDQKVVQLVE
jgi:hypothetical protein